MASIEIRRTHALGMEQAKAAVDTVAQQLHKELQARSQWQGDSLKFDCPGAHGHIEVTHDAVRVSVHLSWLLSAAKGHITKSIEETLDRYLA